MNKDIPKAAEIVVVGAGILGLTTALRLAEAGRDILVIDRAEPFREGSGVNAGSLALQNKSDELLLFYRESLDE
ncbi:MAG: FAD-dependent oxidoreductase, partial [Rhodospirillales bacterium]|nr:FAD-dependent oxidoreductase [Rhodospirillales bacterium]